MGYKLKNKPTYFGLEFDHDVIPNAIVVPSRRGQKMVDWVKSYEPITYKREADGKTVRRERTVVVTPVGFRLRKDEIHAAMKRNKLTSYQDGKFYVVLDHRRGEYEHPTTQKMKKDKAAKEAKTDGKPGKIQESVAPELPGTGETEPVAVPVQDSPDPHNEPVESTTESGLKVTDRRRGVSVEGGEE